jgi:hypothetical protein
LVSGGTKTISLFNNQSSSSALDNMLVAEFSNVQGVIDPLAFNQIPNSGSGSISQAYATVVPNTMLVASTGSNHQFDTNVWSAPFTSISSSGSIYGDPVLCGYPCRFAFDRHCHEYDHHDRQRSRLCR